MNQKLERAHQFDLLDKALSGNQEALEALLSSVQDQIFTLSLRMLGTIHDAQDATQEILIKILTGLSSFRKECAFSTWVFRVAVNHLLNYQKAMFSHAAFSLEAYGEDILHANLHVPDQTGGVDAALLEEELKLSCTNVMLQCLDPESRCIFILGTMFRADSKVAGEILNLSAEAYRQRLSRIRSRMAAFLDAHCGLSGKGPCRCGKRINYAIATGRISPERLEYSALEPDALNRVKDAMEGLDAVSLVFSQSPCYRVPEQARKFFEELLRSPRFDTVTTA